MAAKKTKKKTPGRGRNSTSWKEGQSGNPKGRPPNPISLTTAVKAMGDREAPKATIKDLNDLGANLPDKATWIQTLAARNWIKASDLKTGDVMAKEINERIDGKVPFPLTGAPDGDPIKFKFDFSDLSEKELNLFEKLLSRCQTKTT